MKKIRLGDSGRYAIVDNVDYDLVSQHHWYLEPRKNGTFYAKAKILGRWTRLHRFIMRLKLGIGLVDHDDRNGLNNTRRNLILTNKARNKRNSNKFSGTSRFKGIWKDLKSPKCPWTVRLHIGRYASEHEAATAYRRARKLVFPSVRL